MAHDLNVITALAEDWSAVSSTHIQWVTTPYNFSSTGLCGHPQVTSKVPYRHKVSVITTDI